MPTKKPRQEAGLSPMRAAEKGGGNAAHTETLPQKRLHSTASTQRRAPIATSTNCCGPDRSRQRALTGWVLLTP